MISFLKQTLVFLILLETPYSQILHQHQHFPPLFNCQNVVATSTGEAISSFIQYTATVIEFQQLAFNLLLNVDDVEQFENFSFPFIVEIPFLGVGEWDRNDVTNKVFFNQFLNISTTTSPNEISSFDKIIFIEDSVMKPNHPVFLKSSSWQTLSHFNYSNEIPIPWSSRKLNKITLYDESNKLIGSSTTPDIFLGIISNLSKENQTKHLFQLKGDFHFSETSFYEALNIVTFPYPEPNSSAYIKAGFHEQCAYLFFRRPFIFEETSVFVDMTCVQPGDEDNIQFPFGQARCSKKVLLSHYSQVLSHELMERNITCVGVNMNEWTNWGQNRRRQLKKSKPKPSSRYDVLSTQKREIVLAALNYGAEKASLIYKSTIPNSLVQSPLQIKFEMDISRVPGTLGNVQQMHLARHSPLLITEVGTQWTDVLIASRLANNLPSLVMHPGRCEELVSCSRLNQTQLYFERICYSDERCEKSWFSRGFSIYTPDEYDERKDFIEEERKFH